MGIGFELPPRTYIPKWRGNRDFPEDEQIVVHFTAWMSEEYGALQERVADLTLRLMRDAEKQIEELKKKGDNVKQSESLEAMTSVQAAGRRARRAEHPTALGRVVRLTRGDKVVTDPEDIAATLHQDLLLEDEVALGIIEAGRVGDDEVPFSAPSSTGDTDESE